MKWLGSRLIPKLSRFPSAVERLLRRHEVVGDLGRMHLQAEADALALEHLEDRLQTLRDLLIAALDPLEVVGRERVEQRPDRGAEEPVHLGDAKGGGRARRVFESARGTAAHAFRIAVTPDLGRQDAPVPLVDRIADGLADEVRAEREAPETVAFEQLAPAPHVGRVGERRSDVEVVAPAGELQPVVAPGCRSRRELRKRQVRPLPGEESQRPSPRQGHVGARQVSAC